MTYKYNDTFHVMAIFITNEPLSSRTYHHNKNKRSFNLKKDQFAIFYAKKKEQTKIQHQKKQLKQH